MIKYPEITDISLVTDTISTYQKTIRYDIDNIDIGDISRHFRCIDPPLVQMLYV